VKSKKFRKRELYPNYSDAIKNTGSPAARRRLERLALQIENEGLDYDDYYQADPVMLRVVRSW
jgi:hypothetical protein